MRQLQLPTVTLCAATSVNVDATLAAIAASMEQALFGDAILFTDSVAAVPPEGCRIVSTRPLRSGHDYSRFLLQNVADHVATDHCLVIQWDGFVIHPQQWDDDFLRYDYIGAPWPQFDDGHDVGNGGFSLRSRRLLEACRSPEFVSSHPEDLAICRINRDYLEREHGIIFADRKMAARFSFERSPPAGPTFGFHGIFNMIPLLGADRFWSIYERLSDRSTVYRDMTLMMRQLGTAQKAGPRRLHLIADTFKAAVVRAFRT